MNVLSREKGQGLVEYSLTLILVGVIAVLILALLGPSVGRIFSTVISNI